MFLFWRSNCEEFDKQNASLMSRFYDALTEANRRRQDSDSKSDFGHWELPEVQVPEAASAHEAVFPGSEADYLGTGPTSATAGEIPDPGACEIPPAAAEAGLHAALGLPTTASLDKKARVIPNAINPSVVEHYRRLRTKLLQKREEKPFRTLLVTSPNPQEGKTLTVLNLAYSFALLPDFKVLVVDGDLRRGTLGRWLGVPGNPPGLSDLVGGSVRLEEVVLQSEGIPMHFMLRGNARATDVHASQFELPFKRLASSFDLVIVDSPPVNLLADVQLLASSCEAVLMVARSFMTSRQTLEKAAQELRPFNLIGTVLNASASRSRHYEGYY
jgi:protein-tyrosine kinase